MTLTRLNRWIPILNWLGFLGILITMLMTFFYAPEERTMGNVQRLFYFHVGTAWVAAISFFVALLCGVLYLRKPNKTLDAIAVASVEIGLVLVTMTIVSGSVWGRPAWNTYWIWSPRLISITVMWLVYVAYFMLRGAIDNEERRGRYSAVYLVAGFVTVIMVFIAPRLLRDIHPIVFGEVAETAEGAESGLQDFAPGLESMRMGITLTVSTIGFSLLYLAWLANRLRLQLFQDHAINLRMRLMARLHER
ncbi:MAG: cytochrome c biogenesis protein CcsA [Chloroflexi bacterium]|nr:cytochrome c biogenesis protein CcsA [Chloroflexota bacterium]MBP8058785.1 cytochrome c biogenesis protein CcsA [Chloroflexota bacterium]